MEISTNDVHWLGTGAFASKKQGSDGILIKFDLQETHYTIQTWSISGAEPDFGRQPTTPPEAIFPFDHKLTELDIAWLNELPADEEILLAFESSSELLSSLVMGGKLLMTTGYEPDARGVEQYLIFPSAEPLPPSQMESVVDNVVRIENHFHLLHLPEAMRKREEAIITLRDIETKAAQDLKRINENLPRADADILKYELHSLSDGFVQVSELSEEFQQYHQDIVGHENALKSAFQTLREEPTDAHLPLSSPILKSAMEISSRGDWFFTRIERVRQQKTDIINILRTKVELLERDLSLSLQRSVDKTTKSQVAMQRSVEGLYVFIVAFYLTELALIIFEAMEEREIIHTSPTLLAALFIPLAILAGLFLSGKLGGWLDHLSRD